MLDSIKVKHHPSDYAGQDGNCPGDIIAITIMMTLQFPANSYTPKIMNIGNIFESIPSEIKAEIFEPIAQSGTVKIERIISHGHRSPATGWYDQNQNEWVMVVQGAAKIEFEGGESVTLEAGSYLNIPAHTKHQVAWTTTEMETIWLAVHY